MSDVSDRTRAARRRRAEGTVAMFSGRRLSVARRMARLPRTALARQVGVTPTAITQLEHDYIKPTLAVAAELSLALGVPRNFLERSVSSIEPIAASTAHFRSLRSTPALVREQALAYAELGLELLAAIEDYVDLPAVSLPHLDPHEMTTVGIEGAAAEARRYLGVADGPVPNVVRLLEAHGVFVLRAPDEIVDRRVDAFSTSSTIRPLVILSANKDDKARSRFDAAHELGHLILHSEAEPGSKIIENEANAFAASFLTPADQVVDDLPRRLDWQELHRAKRRWGVSLKALLYRAHALGLINDNTYRRGNIQLAEWGTPEPSPLGSPEQPSLLGTATGLLVRSGISIEQLAEHAELPLDRVETLIQSATDHRPQLLDL